MRFRRPAVHLPAAALLAGCLAFLAPADGIQAAPCPRVAGDLAPGTLIPVPGAPPRFSPQGDGRIDITDVVSSLREAVGLQVIDGPLVGGDCASMPADLAPGRLDSSTTPPTWHPVGDGVVNIADVLVELRAATGLVQVAPLPERRSELLREAASCLELEQHLKQLARARFDAQGSWGGDWWWARWGGNPFIDAGADADGGPVPAEGGASSHSDTNVQVSGVDEPDLVDTDGSLLVSLAGGELRVLRAFPVESLELLASLPIEGSPTGLFLDRGHVVVLSQVWGIDEVFGPPPGGFAPRLGALKITVLDLANPAAPRLVRELYFDGWLHAARNISGRVVLVLYHALHGPELPPWQGDHDAYVEAALQVIDSSTLGDWLPDMVDVRHAAGGSVVLRRPVLECEDIRLLVDADSPRGGFVNLLELDAIVPGQIGAAAIAGHASTVHVSRHRVIVAADDWGFSPALSDIARTRLHSFALGGPDGKPRYLGAGEIPGWILSPWSMDVHRGGTGDELRVATQQFDDMGRLVTGVHVLLPDGTGDMKVTGAVTGLAPGEMLHAARFMGDRGYLVTYERIDPLFVLDLADPADPRVTGELEVTGWSSYLHPLGEGRLIGVGREVDPDTQEQIGMQVSLFDVSDPARPLLEDRHVEAIGWQASEAEWDHHAFTYFAPLSMLALPMVAARECADCETGWMVANQLLLFRIAPGEGITPAGVLDVPYRPCGGWARRAVFLDDFVLGIGDAGIAAARVASPGVIVSSVIHSGADGCGDDSGGDSSPGGGGGG